MLCRARFSDLVTKITCAKKKKFNLVILSSLTNLFDSSVTLQLPSKALVCLLRGGIFLFPCLLLFAITLTLGLKVKL